MSWASRREAIHRRCGLTPETLPTTSKENFTGVVVSQHFFTGRFEMNRETYRRGIQMLKSKIKEMTKDQSARKHAMRLPRKTAADFKALQAAVDIARPPKPNYSYDIGWVQTDAAIAKPVISGYLNAYAELRGKEKCHTPDPKAGSFILGFVKQQEERARKEFLEECDITLEQYSAQLTTGEST